VRKTTDIAFVEEQINQVLMIKGFLESVPDLHRALAPARGALLVKVRDLCRPEISGRILNDIRTAIEPDVTYSKSPLDLRNQRTFAVRAGISGMLDVARQTYKELTEEIHQHVEEIRKCHSMNVVLRFDNARKYWLRIKADQCEDGALPELFINCVRRKDNIECQTLDLIKLNLRLSDTSNEVVIRSDDVVQRLIASLRTEAPHLFRVCESVALVDMIASFGQLASTHDYVKPEITSTMALKAARHPILDQVCPR
jgi:DNA mismatch repair protein MSH4